MKEQTAKEVLKSKGVFRKSIEPFNEEVLEAMEEYATFKLQEKDKEIERLKGERDMFMERCNQLTKTNDELQAIITKHITNH